MSIDHTHAKAELSKFRGSAADGALLICWSVGGNEFRARSRKLLDRPDKYPLIAAILNNDLSVSRHEGMGLAMYHIPKERGLDLCQRCHVEGIPLFWGGEID